ncbi:hypothetical protein J7W19_29780 [Streptomyces mobaraensis NBRC 13819 = DSM 40847]|uniref:Uncharacterized protein n=1 Tax=Streptomyces mobaraensis TaxID=35621 RepID=A0A5N5W9N5_STRMB|nr:hypothetical protein FRZ00_13850 [Streptomyces mobaraensis]QTT77018.1 hypothetical protein J7W19_29780 [Streptomyces mobaraensis NBRC 13819 = DSM 40847]
MLERFRRHIRPAGRDGNAPARRPPDRQHNLFEAAAVYVAACAENDPDRSAEAARWVSPEALSFGVNELACRALVALARERGTSPQHVARSLLGLPAA